MKKDVLYHISHSDNRESILRNGLVPTSKKGRIVNYKNRVYLFRDIDRPPFHISGWNNMDIWEVAGAPKVKKDEFADPGAKWVYVNRVIPPSRLKLLKTVASQEEAMTIFFKKQKGFRLSI